MSNDNPDTERLPRPEGEALIEEYRTMTHTAVTTYVIATASGAGLKTGSGIVEGVKQAGSKAMDAFSSKGDDAKSSDDSKD